MNNREKYTLIVVILLSFIAVLGITYAYFTAEITGTETTSTIIVSGGEMSIVYENNSNTIVVQNIYPRSEAWVTKNFTVTGTNTTDLKMKYKVGLDIEENTFPNEYLTYSLENTNSDSGTPISDRDDVPINGSSTKWFGEGLFVTGRDQEHAYTLKIYFKDSGENQNDAQNASFKAKVIIEEAGTGEIARSVTTTFIGPVFDINYNECIDAFSDIWYGGDPIPAEDAEEINAICTDGYYGSNNLEDTIINSFDMTLEEAEQEGIIENLTEGVRDYPSAGYEYVDGQYTYIYQKHYNPLYDEWGFTNADGWSVVLTDVLENGGNSTTPVTTVLIKEINGEPVVDMTGMFYGSKATSIDLSSFDTSNVVSMTAMFDGTQASTLDLSHLNTSKVQDMSYMFADAQATSLDLSSFDTSNVVDMNNMFQGSAATSLDLSSFDISSVRSLQSMFEESSVSSLDLSHFNNSDVTDMSRMFKNSSLESLNLSGFDFSNAYYAEFLHNCTNLEVLNLSGANFSHITNAFSFFTVSGSSPNYIINGCTNIRELNLSNADFSRVSSVNSMFAYTPFQTINLSGANFSNLVSMDDMFIYSYVSNVIFTGAVIPRVTEMYSMFSNVDSESLSIIGLNTSNVTNMHGMFADSKVKSLDLSWMDTSSVTNMHGMFSGSEATSINLSSFDTSKVTDMSGMFYESKAETLDFSSFDTSHVTNMSSMFYGCETEVLDLSPFDMSSVTYSGTSAMFKNALATTGYARTQADANKFNRSESERPAGLTFVVKP